MSKIMDDNNPNVTQIIHNSLNLMANNPYPNPPIKHNPKTLTGPQLLRSVASSKKILRVHSLNSPHSCKVEPRGVKKESPGKSRGHLYTTVFVDTRLWNTKTPAETFLKFPSVLRVIDRSTSFPGSLILPLLGTVRWETLGTRLLTDRIAPQWPHQSQPHSMT